MRHAPPTFMRAALASIVVTAAAIDALSALLHSSWVLPLGSLAGALISLGIVFWGPWKPSLREVVRKIGQDAASGETIFIAVSGALLLGFLTIHMGTHRIGGICVQPASCDAGELLNLTPFALFLPFIMLAWLYTTLLALEQLRRRGGAQPRR